MKLVDVLASDIDIVTNQKAAETIGSKIRKQVIKERDEYQDQNLSLEELKALKVCMEIAYTESENAITKRTAILSFFITILSLFGGSISLVVGFFSNENKSTLIILGIIWIIYIIIAGCIFAFHFFVVSKRDIKSTIKFRNKIFALISLILDKEIDLNGTEGDNSHE